MNQELYRKGRPTMSDDQTPKIIVDDDWKSQAKAEKEKLRASESSKPAEGAGGAPEKIGFEHLLELLATQALMYLGAFPDPQTGKAIIAPDMARLHIDLLGVVEEKTRGNLTESEKAKIEGILHELRMQYVEITKAVAKAVEEGKINPADLKGGGSGSGTAPGAES
ncbi:MAG: DUF1844 domain-containing protein [Planctomycetota bacterium]|nr:MAG: DUF1844 domain-containing protein [Planctomycetota bacterium]